MHPLEEMSRDEILEAGSPVVDHRPVEVVVLLSLLDGSNLRRPEWRQPKDRVEPLEDGDPALRGLVTDLEVFTKRVDRQQRADDLGQPEHQQLETTQVIDALE